MKRWLESVWAQGLTLFLVLASIAAGTVFQVGASYRERCVERWADAYSARSQLLTDATQRRADALDELLRAAGGTDQQAKAAAYDAYLRASADYRKTLAHNPLPEPPKLRC